MLAISVFFYSAAGMMVYQGKAGRDGHISTRDADPVGFWSQVGLGVFAGTAALAYGTFMLVRGKTK